MHSSLKEGKENALSVVNETGLKGESQTEKHWTENSENNFGTMIKKGPT